MKISPIHKRFIDSLSLTPETKKQIIREIEDFYSQEELSGAVIEAVYLDEQTKMNKQQFDKFMKSMKRRKPKITDTRRFKLEDDDFIPFVGGRPKRDKPISKDDVVNLVIALHKCRTLSEFLERV